MSEPTSAEFRERIAKLEARVDALTVRLEKEIKQNHALYRLGNALRASMKSRLDDIGERMKHIELKLFPNLAGAMRSVQEIVQFDENGWNELDYRDPWG
jgi:hypothetical protein